MNEKFCKKFQLFLVITSIDGVSFKIFHPKRRTWKNNNQIAKNGNLEPLFLTNKANVIKKIFFFSKSHYEEKKIFNVKKWKNWKIWQNEQFLWSENNWKIQSFSVFISEFGMCFVFGIGFFFVSKTWCFFFICFQKLLFFFWFLEHFFFSFFSFQNTVFFRNCSWLKLKPLAKNYAQFVLIVLQCLQICAPFSNLFFSEQFSIFFLIWRGMEVLFSDLNVLQDCIFF